MTELEQKIRQELYEVAKNTPIYNNVGESIERTEEEILESIDTQINFEKNHEIKWLELRNERNKKLSWCDWTQLSDAPITEELKSEWASYRQALRDLPSNTEFPGYVDFPLYPGEVRLLPNQDNSGDEA